MPGRLAARAPSRRRYSAAADRRFRLAQSESDASRPCRGLNTLDEMPRSHAITCVYCVEPVLTGSDDPEHAVPAAINGRFTTRAVCVNCNRWAGEEIDRPWLDDPFVRHVRFVHRIPDRRGNTIESDPLLTGTTASGRRITIGRDGRPKQLNSPVDRSKAPSEFSISARDHQDLDRLIDRELRKAGKTREDVDLPSPRVVEDQPAVKVQLEMNPSRWERIAAKMTLALLGENRAPEWRLGSSAGILRERMRDREIKDVRMQRADSFRAFAAEPSTAIVVSSMRGVPAAFVSLLGVFAIMFPLTEDLRDVELGWVSDPLDPCASVSGPIARVAGARVLADDAEAS